MDLDVSKLREDFKEPHYLLTASDGKILFIREWKPPKASNVAIFFFHGITAHSGAYDNLMAKPLAKAGYSIFGLDLRGHGLSDGNRGDCPSKDRLIKDLCESIDFVKKKCEKLIILGHSLGVVSAIIATNHCLGKIDGLILLSAGRTAKPGVYKKPSFGQTMKILFSSIFMPNKPVIAYYREGMTGLDDPLRVFKYTFRFMRVLNPKALVFPEKLKIPVIVGVGDQDEIFDVESPRALLNEIPADNKKFMIIKGAKHAEFLEASWKELIDWMNKNFK